MRLVTTVELLERGIRDGLHLGGQLFVSRAGRVEADLALGEARPGEPMTPDHLVHWLSCGKPITAVAVAQLWERGQLSLDDPVAKHLPEFSAGGKEGVTVRHLLTHTSGIRALRLGWPDVSWDELVAKISAMKLEPRWTPGEKAGYHLSSSWFILGELVQRLDGRELPDYLRQEIFQPLGMDDCWIGMPAERFREYGSLVAGVFDTENDRQQHRWSDEARMTRPSPGSSAVGPMNQLARFYAMLLADGEVDGHRVMSPQTVSALTARHRVGLWDHTFRAQLDWGLGFIVNSSHHGEENSPYGYGPHASPRTFGHSGFRSTAAFADPAHALVICLEVNGTPAEDAHRARFEALTAAIYEDLELVRAR